MKELTAEELVARHRPKKRKGRNRTDQPKEPFKSPLQMIMDGERLDPNWHGHTCLGETLAALGFASLTAYEASHLWDGIVRKELFVNDWRCHCCPDRAGYVYRSSCELKVMGGAVRWRDLNPLCDRCYSRIVFDGCRTRKPAEAYAAYMELRDLRRRNWSRKKHDKVDEMIANRFRAYRVQKG